MQYPRHDHRDSRTAYFSVFTKDKSAAILDIRNGYLGWHYVNKVDTCIFVSLALPLEKGTSTVLWNGKGDGDVLVPPGDYTYYLWAYDNQTPKIQVTATGFVPNRSSSLEEFDQTGYPLSNPFITNWSNKWVLGNDPSDASLVEKTNIVFAAGFDQYGPLCFQPGNYSNFFIQSSNEETGISE